MVNISNVFEVYAIKKPTRAKFFEDLRCGDKIEISLDIERTPGTARIKIKNLKNEVRVYKTISELNSCLSCFELRKVKVLD